MKYVTVDKGRPSLTPIQSDAPEKVTYRFIDNFINLIYESFLN